jgi:hypothetical protein
MFEDEMCEYCFGKKEIVIQSAMNVTYPCIMCALEDVTDNPEPSLEDENIRV